MRIDEYATWVVEHSQIGLRLHGNRRWRGAVLVGQTMSHEVNGFDSQGLTDCTLYAYNRQVVLRIDIDSEVPAYRQIVDALRPMLIDGKLAPGELLPPVRQLAADLGVHFNTVAEAYRLLAEEGWLELRRGRGAAVLPRKMPRADSAATSKFSRRLRQLIAEIRASGVPTSAIADELRQIAQGLEP